VKGKISAGAEAEAEEVILNIPAALDAGAD
jgi:hypothetical protein